MISRLVVAACLCAALSTPATADWKTLIGKTDYDVAACAGPPASVMQFSGNREILVYEVASSSGGVFGLGNGVFGGVRRTNSCQAIIQVQNGVVTNIEWKKAGGLITSALNCTQVLSGC